MDEKKINVETLGTPMMNDCLYLVGVVEYRTYLETNDDESVGYMTAARYKGNNVMEVFIPGEKEIPSFVINYKLDSPKENYFTGGNIARSFHIEKLQVMTSWDPWPEISAEYSGRQEMKRSIKECREAFSRIHTEAEFRAFADELIKATNGTTEPDEFWVKEETELILAAVFYVKKVEKSDDLSSLISVLQKEPKEMDPEYFGRFLLLNGRMRTSVHTGVVVRLLPYALGE